jgi:ADP-ribose pyrophosphatase
MQKWKTSSISDGGNFIIFDIDRVTRVHPETNKESEFIVARSKEWVNIIPLTSEGEVVLVKQYRHGTDQITLEIPGGLVDEGEDPKMAGVRECKEETGYTSQSNAELVGKTLPNPAFMNNTCYTYLLRDCKLTSSVKFDPNELIETVVVPLSEIPKLIKEGIINHSLVISAFLHFSLRYPDEWIVN